MSGRRAHMGMSVTISAAAEQDAEQIFRLQYLCFQSEAALYGNYRIDPLVQSLDSVREEVASDCVFVARLGEEVVGSVRGTVTEDGAAAISCVRPSRPSTRSAVPRCSASTRATAARATSASTAAWATSRSAPPRAT